MKKLLFIHGGEKVKEDEEGNLYTDGSYSKEVWKRYKKLCDQLTVIFRKEKKIYDSKEAKEKFQELDKDILFYEINNRTENLLSYFSIEKKLENRRTVYEHVKNNDIIIARVPSSISYYAIKVAKKMKKKVITEVVGCPFDSMWNHGIRGKILAVSSYFKMRKCVWNSPNVIYVTSNFLQHRYPTKGYNIGCSDVSLSDINYNIEKRNKVLKEKKDAIVLGTCGAIDVKYKGHRYVLEAIKNLSDEGYKIEYQVVGGGSQAYINGEAKKNNVYDNIKILGSLKHEDVFNWLDSIDIYIQPSNTEGLSRALIEAMSCACPSIASNAGGNPELIDSACVFKKKNVKELTDIIKKVIKGDINYYEEALRNYNESKNYSKSNLDAKRADFYFKALNG